MPCLLCRRPCTRITYVSLVPFADVPVLKVVLRGDGSITETTPFLPPGQHQEQANNRAHLIKAALYGVQNFYAFMLM